MVLFPIFAHCYLELMTRNFVTEAKAFFDVHSEELRASHSNELKSLSLIVTPNHIEKNPVIIFYSLLVLSLY